ncbi:MAG: GIY-YIG nuclease family protein, partial [Prevotellaceae bacterium]|nr:GIY-YIG nuclease family protein [Prevotellaceae bacterium]
MEQDSFKEYIYIGQYLNAAANVCKIGKSNDLERRLKEYNHTTGLSTTTKFQFLFTCEVKNMAQVENDIKKNFSAFREAKSREIYFFNPALFEKYVEFIKSHPLFVEEIPVENADTKPFVKIVKKTTPSLKEWGLTHRDVMRQAQKADYDEFYTRYEDVEKEIAMYDKEIWK